MNVVPALLSARINSETLTKTDKAPLNHLVVDYTQVMRARAFLLAVGLSVLSACSQVVPAAPAPDPVGAYQVIVESLCPGNRAGSIFAIDVSGTGLPEPERLFAALKADPRYHAYTMMSATRAELEESGLINKNEMHFENGFLIEFFHPSLSAGQVTVEGSIWEGGLAAAGATYTARWESSAWVLDEPTSRWVA